MKRPKVERLKGQASLWAERRAVLKFRGLMSLDIDKNLKNTAAAVWCYATYVKCVSGAA